MERLQVTTDFFHFLFSDQLRILMQVFIVQLSRTITGFDRELVVCHLKARWVPSYEFQPQLLRLTDHCLFLLI